MRGDRRELRTDEQPQACDICGRTILKGERTEVYLAPGGHRRLVCELCAPRADHEGWIRESAAADLPAARARPAPRRSLRSRLGLGGGAQRHEPAAAEPATTPGAPQRDQGNGRPEREARNIRAVPTTAEVKVERALELFNGSDHPRTIAGIARSLGPAWVYVGPSPSAPSEVDIVIAWELSWYRYKVDLGDASEPIVLLEKGDELGEVGENLRQWNGAIDENGRISDRPSASHERATP